MPTQKLENILREQGIKHIAGVDEAGRGALAGPIVAAAVILPRHPRIPRIDDSKLLSPQVRMKLHQKITRTAMAYSISIQSAHSIDEKGIGWANRAVMREAIETLTITPQYVLTDYLDPGINLPLQNIVKGDQRIYTIAAASILAKVTRDIILTIAAKHFPLYGFHRHKGYGTQQHIEKIRLHGSSVFHRKSFLRNVV